MLIPFVVLLLVVLLLVYLTDPAKVETVLRILAILLVCLWLAQHLAIPSRALF